MRRIAAIMRDFRLMQSMAREFKFPADPLIQEKIRLTLREESFCELGDLDDLSYRLEPRK
jgi:hypothetical protein